MKWNNSKYGFKCGLLMKTVIFISIASSLIFALFNIYVTVNVEDILQMDNNKSFIVTKLYFIFESIKESLKNGGQVLYLLSFIFSLLLIFGDLLMWFGKIYGLLFYFISKIMLVILPVLFLDESALASGDIMLAAFFITFYSIYILKHKFKIE
ncbi:MAG: hypothetical protein LBR28_00080 [Bacteroidales bacterium]|jgi:hypothetical protein|nr:hypothetical protein [Bacteroidales bacterium]